jgi:citrate lyase subunit beta / citryl-CoA lyase
MRLMRSKLFVPGSRPDLFAKAAASAADALSFDLEDAVTQERKVEARGMLADYLRARQHRQLVVVRINALGTPYCDDDIAAIAPTHIDIVNMPMAEEPEEVVEIAQKLERHDPTDHIRLLVNIETPKGLRQARKLAQAHPRVMGLQVGYADLLEPCGINRMDQATLAYIRVSVRLAAGEAALPVYDGAFFDVGDPEACRAESIAARKSGFAGKSCIHPSQVDIVNEAFSPTPVEIERARRIFDAAEKAKKEGVGAFLVDGQMIDAPFLPRVRAIIEWADKEGLK